MDKSDAIKVANEYASVISTNYDCKDIFMFGSYAKGTYHDESDIDIAVILKDFDNPINIQLELMRLRRKIDSRIEPHPFREKDFNINNPVAYEILQHGQRIDI
ncbi:DNA polymerase beta domain protein region [Desulfamplus magnetovallimortis]|uniref:DNA polymerase beta domain protein region n=1 Tax=Desulfamplus magnetovallimortis TaxID=1246637 RepID=A0A1W1H652_9BACT|nr:nucleotidyltransferase domain-containing protein [Desulfamplus magnetovallimortis]SLM27848.1 DNA polymerase beta domain protein region [Desulfamplus magnetovallimortis]